MFKVLTKGCEPTRGSKYSACVDLYASEDVVIGAGETKLVGLGVAIDLEKLDELLFIADKYKDAEKHIDMEEVFNNFLKSHYLQLMLRSSLGKKGLILPSGVGIIDLDYAEEIKMIIHNPLSHVRFGEMNGGCDGNNAVEIKKGNKIAQITLLEHKGYLFGIDTDKERDGGFGSTGK